VLKHFLCLLQWFRRVLLQDAAVLSMSHCELPIFSFSPFNTPAFHVFAKTSTAVMVQAEEDAQLALHNLPENIAYSFRGMIAGVTLEQQRVYTAQNREIAHLTESVNQMVGIVQMERSSNKRRCRKAQQGLTWYLYASFVFLIPMYRCCDTVGTSPICGVRSITFAHTSTIFDAFKCHQLTSRPHCC
jgi:hypothetical protein